MYDLIIRDRVSSGCRDRIPMLHVIRARSEGEHGQNARAEIEKELMAWRSSYGHWLSPTLD